MIGKYNKTVWLTYLGALFSIIAMFFALNNLIKYSMIFFILAGICDLFDGFIARKFKRTKEEKEFGVQIDTLVDMVSFVFLPIILMYSLGLNTIYHFILFFLYTLAAIIRLAYFNINLDVESDKSIDYYTGLPVTYVSLILPIIYLLSYFISLEVLNIIYIIAMSLITLFFILKIKIAKPRGVFYILFSLLAIIVITLLMIFY